LQPVADDIGQLPMRHIASGLARYFEFDRAVDVPRMARKVKPDW
jgi:hypothetical protein